MADKTMDADAKLDETIEETFPASDAPANTPETGIRLNIGAIEGEASVQDNLTAADVDPLAARRSD